MPDTLLETICLSPSKATPLTPEARGAECLLGDDSTVRSPLPRFEVCRGLWVDYAPDAGVETDISQTAEGLRFSTHTTGTSPWYSLSFDIDINALRDSDYLGIKFDLTSSGPARLRVCLRYHLADGFRDSFAKEVIVLTGGVQSGLITHPIQSVLTSDALGSEVLLFVEGRSFDFTLGGLHPILI